MKEIGSEFEVTIKYKELYVSDLIWIYGGINRRVKGVIKNRIKKDPALIIKLMEEQGHPINEKDLFFYQTGLSKLTNRLIDSKIISIEEGSIRSRLIVGIPTFLLGAGVTTIFTNDPRFLIPVSLVVYIITVIADESSEQIEQQIIDWLQNIPEKSTEKGKESQEIFVDYKRIQ